MSTMTEALAELLDIDGALGCAIVDSNTGLLLGKAGGGLDLELAAAGNTEVLRAKLDTVESLGLDEHVEDILITLGRQFHVLRLIESMPGLFIYLVLDKDRANLAMARLVAQGVEKTLQL